MYVGEKEEQVKTGIAKGYHQMLRANAEASGLLCILVVFQSADTG